MDISQRGTVHPGRCRCVGGPYAGQTFTIPPIRDAVYSGQQGWTFPLVWVINGTKKHCYRIRRNGQTGDFRLVYQDTF